MKRRMLSVVSLAAVLAVGGLYGRAVNVDLNGAWKLETFAQPDDGAVRSLPLPKGLAVKCYQATVPGCCEMELVKAGEMPDPMFSTNALAFTALEGNQWLYTKTRPSPVLRANRASGRCSCSTASTRSRTCSSTGRRSARRRTCSFRTSST